MVNTPVLFETFVRVEYARQVWEAIKEAQPRKLYFYSNKGRAEKEGEVERNNEIRSWIKEIDWDCDLHTWFRDECVDVYTSLRGAISWLFDNEETGIILEDDCVPTMSFFSFIDQMLELYKDEKKIWGVSGCNFFEYNPSGYDVIFSHTHYLYGWATWANRWHTIDWDDVEENFNSFIRENKCYKLYSSSKQARWEEKAWKKRKDFLLKTKCWDFVWDLTVDANNGVIVYPSRHLITNIGIIGIHHQGDAVSPANNTATEMGPNYSVSIFPPKICADNKYDFFMWKKLKYRSLVSRIISRFFQIISLESK